MFYQKIITTLSGTVSPETPRYHRGLSLERPVTTELFVRLLPVNQDRRADYANVRMLTDNQLGCCLTANWLPTCHTSTFICADVCMYKECVDYHKSLLQYITINSFYPTSYIKIVLYTKIDIRKLYHYNISLLQCGYMLVVLV